MTPPAQTISFGPFELTTTEKQPRRNGVLVKRCPRAYDIPLVMVTASDLAVLLSGTRVRRDRAKTLLQQACARFTEGFDTVDLQAAHRILRELS